MVVVEPCRERPAPHHVSHGEIHEDNEKACRGDQPVFESRCLVVFECFFSLGHGNLFFVGSFEWGAVACLLYGSDDIVGWGSSFHPHRICQKADGTGCDSRNFWYSLFYTGWAGSAAHAGDVILFHYGTSLWNTERISFQEAWRLVRCKDHANKEDQ